MEKFREKIYGLIAETAFFLFLNAVLTGVCFSQQNNLQITYTRNLEFRNLIPGVRKTVTETSPDAGKFIIRCSGARCVVNVSFNLSGNISSGAGNVPAVFTATHSANSNDNQPGIPFNPYSGTTLTFDDKTKEYYIRIGGSLNPANIQGAGEYTAPVIIILTILYD